MSYLERRQLLACCANSNCDGSEMQIAKFPTRTLVVNQCRRDGFLEENELVEVGDELVELEVAGDGVLYDCY